MVSKSRLILNKKMNQRLWRIKIEKNIKIEGDKRHSHVC